MRWDIAENMRCDLVAFTGVNFSGRRSVVEIFPSGKKGDLEGDAIQSLYIMAPLGTRIVLIASASESDWEQHTWRAIELRKGSAFKSKQGLPAVRLPDLDLMTKPNAERSDPDREESYPLAATLAEGKDWTYGRVGMQDLKNHIQAIRIEKVS